MHFPLSVLLLFNSVPHFLLLVLARRTFNLSANNLKESVIPSNIWRNYTNSLTRKEWFKIIQAIIIFYTLKLETKMTFVHVANIAKTKKKAWKVWEVSYETKVVSPKFSSDTDNATIIVSRPLGFFRAFEDLSHFSMKVTRKFYIGEYKIKWLFNLWKSLHLNVTFSFINLEYKGHVNCVKGNITIMSPTEETEPLCKFCGKYSYVPFYSISNDVSMTLSVFDLKNYDIKFFFGVTNANEIRSLSQSTPITNSVERWNLHFLREEIMLHKFLLVASVTSSIEIFLQEKVFKYSLQVYDGPGTLSKLLPLQHSSYQTRTFQCTLYLWHSYEMHSDENMKIEYNFHAVNLKVTRIQRVTEPMALHHSEGNLNCTFCLWNITTSQGLFLNITVISFVYKGDPNLNCKYAGIAALEVQNNRSLRKISHSCISDQILYKHRNIFTSKPQVLFLFYYHQEYGVLSLEIFLNISKCVAIQIDLCYLNRMDALSRPVISQFSHGNVNFSINNLKLKFVPVANECIIAQFMTSYLYKNITERMGRCLMSYFGPTTNFEGIYEYDVAGVFSGE